MRPRAPSRRYIEVPFLLGERKLYPDGLIRVSRGARSWTALVEVKTGSNELATEQLENYLDIAREQGFDAVITISNEIPAIAGQHPTKVDKRKLKRVALHHLAWNQVLAEAVMQKEFRGVADPDQAWILGELIRYLEHSRVRCLGVRGHGRDLDLGARRRRRWHPALHRQGHRHPSSRVHRLLIWRLRKQQSEAANGSTAPSGSAVALDGHLGLEGSPRPLGPLLSIARVHPAGWSCFHAKRACPWCARMRDVDMRVSATFCFRDAGIRLAVTGVVVPRTGYDGWTDTEEDSMSRNTISRSLHDLGLAARFGGTLANAVALNTAASEAADSAGTGRVTNAGWDSLDAGERRCHRRLPGRQRRPARRQR